VTIRSCCAALSSARIHEEHEAYLGHWLTVLKEDKRAIFGAAAHAQCAAAYLQALQQQNHASPRSTF
jgi:antirestriction protein ArdC